MSPEHLHTYMTATYCADDKHSWRELRNRNCKNGDTWFLFKGCRHCPAVLETLVTHFKTEKGELVPVVRVYLLTGYGFSRPDVPGETVTKEVAGVLVNPQPIEAKLIKGPPTT